MFSFRKRKGRSLLKAIWDKDFQGVQRYLQKGADVNYSDYPSLTRTPLIYAAEDGDLETIDYLIKHGADVNAQAAIDTFEDYSVPFKHRLRLAKNGAFNGLGKTALYYAVDGMRMDVVDLLLKSDANPNLPSEFVDLKKGRLCPNQTPLMLVAVKTGACWCIGPKHTRPGMGPNTCNNEKVDEEYTALARMLLSYGAGVKVEDISGMTPLADACSGVNMAFIKMLLEAGAEVNPGGERFLVRPLVRALIRERLGVVRLLLENGAKITRKEFYDHDSRIKELERKLLQEAIESLNVDAEIDDYLD